MNLVRLRFPLVILCSAALLVAQPALGRRSAPQVDNAQFEALPLHRSPQNHLIVRAFINGKPALLAVDTGAPVSAVAANRRQHYGLTSIPGTSKLPPRIMINGGLSSVGIAKSLRIGELTLMDEPMVAVNLGPESRAARIRGEQEIDGILGADILFPTRAVLDCQRQLLILNLDPDSQKVTPGVDYTGLSSLPIHVSEGYNLYVDGAVNGAPGQLLVDTGAFATLLHRPFVQQMKIPMRRTRLLSAGVNTIETHVQVARIRRLSVGEVDVVGNYVGVIDLAGLLGDQMLGGKRPVVGLLGGELLQRLHGIIDFGTRRLYLKG